MNQSGDKEWQLVGCFPLCGLVQNKPLGYSQYLQSRSKVPAYSQYSITLKLNLIDLIHILVTQT